MIDTWEDLYERVWNTMEFQVHWNNHCINNNVYDIKIEYGDKQYEDLKNEFTEMYIKERLLDA